MKQIVPWWKRVERMATLKTADGRVAENVLCHIGAVQYPNDSDRTVAREPFTFHTQGPYSADRFGLALLKTGQVTELCINGVWRAASYMNATIADLDEAGNWHGGTRQMTLAEWDHYFQWIVLFCDPVPERFTSGVQVNSKPSAKDQILDALRSAPDGLTAQQIGEQTECSQRWVFMALNALFRERKVTKNGATYQLVSAST